MFYWGREGDVLVFETIHKSVLQVFFLKCVLLCSGVRRSSNHHQTTLFTFTEANAYDVLHKDGKLELW